MDVHRKVIQVDLQILVVCENWGCPISLIRVVIEPVEMTWYAICGGFDKLNHRNLNFSDDLITVETLVKEMEFKTLTNQYSFHTERAIKYLTKTGVKYV